MSRLFEKLSVSMMGRKLEKTCKIPRNVRLAAHGSQFQVMINSSAHRAVLRSQLTVCKNTGAGYLFSVPSLTPQHITLPLSGVLPNDGKAAVCIVLTCYRSSLAKLAKCSLVIHKYIARPSSHKPATKENIRIEEFMRILTASLGNESLSGASSMGAQWSR